MIVELMKTNHGLGIKKGYYYKAEPYWLDPSKVTLLRRVTKNDLREIGKPPECNQYRHNVKILRENV